MKRKIPFMMYVNSKEEAEELIKHYEHYARQPIKRRPLTKDAIIRRLVIEACEVHSKKYNSLAEMGYLAEYVINSGEVWAIDEAPEYAYSTIAKVIGAMIREKDSGLFRPYYNQYSHTARFNHGNNTGCFVMEFKPETPMKTRK